MATRHEGWLAMKGRRAPTAAGGAGAQCKSDGHSGVIVSIEHVRARVRGLDFVDDVREGGAT